MKKIFIALSALLFTACSLFPSAFDGQEHARIVSIHVVSKDNTVCNQPDQTKSAINQMYHDAEWVYHYGSTLGDNEEMTKMELMLLGMIREMRDRYAREERVSVLYCRSKFDNVHRATETIMRVSARRPRS